ncbi:hypothetical protein EMIT074MI3_10025 [Bacillus licheniformis]
MKEAEGSNSSRKDLIWINKLKRPDVSGLFFRPFKKQAHDISCACSLLFA